MEMGYSPEAYEKAELILSEYRRAASVKLLQRTEELNNKIPEIKDIEEQIHNLGIELTKAAMTSEEISVETEAKLCDLEKKKKALLVKNGYAEDYLVNAHNCTSCRDTGFVNGVMCSCLRKMLAEFDSLTTAVSTDYSFENFRIDVYSDEIIAKCSISGLFLR